MSEDKPPTQRVIGGYLNVCYERLDGNCYQSPAKIAIVANLDHLQQLMDQYLASQPEDSAAGLRALFVKDFVVWVRAEQEKTDEHI